MRVMLIQSYLGKGIPLAFPLGLSYLAACLPEHEVYLLDLNTCSSPYQDLEETLKKFDPQVIGISLRNIDDQNRLSIKYFYEEFQETIKYIKSVSPEVPLITGGAGFSMFACQIMKRNSEPDFGVAHEAENSLPELLKNLESPQKVKGVFYRENGDVIFTGRGVAPDVKEIPFPRRDIVDLGKYESQHFALGIETKRGCCLDCKYCNYPFLSGNKVRLREPESVVDEIQELVDKHGIKGFIFTDSVFNAPKEQARRICREIIDRNIKVDWAAYFDIRFADPELLVLAKQAGCRDFIFSPDAASNAALRGLNKGIITADIHETIKLFRENKDLKRSYACFGFFLNAPGENFKGLLLTLYLALKIKLMFRGRGNSSVGWIRIEPDTGVYQVALDNSMLQPEEKLLPESRSDLKRLFYSQPPLNRLDFIILGFFRTLRMCKRTVKTILRRK